MSLSKVRELREQRAKLAEQMAGMAKIQAESGKPMSAEDRAKFDQIDKDQESLKGQIDVLERSAQAEAETRGTVKPPESQVGDGADQLSPVSEYREALREHGTKALDHIRPEARSAVRKLDRRFWDAMKDYLARGEGGMSAESRAIITGANNEFRDMGIGTNTLGGYFVPQGFVYKIEEALKYYGDMLNVAEILDTATGQTLPYPTDNDTTITGEIVGEGKQVSIADVTIGHINLGAFKFSTKMIKVSLELLQDSAFDMQAYLQNKMATRLGRILNTKFTVGAGTTEPNGIVTAVVANNGSAQTWGAGSGPGIPLVAAGSSANTGGSETGGTTIGYADWVNLEHSVDPLYRRGAKWMMHDTTLRQAKTLLDKYGRPIWVPGMTAGAPDTILTYGYSVNNDMAQIAVNAKTVLFGALNKYLIRRVKELGIMRLNERFADYGQVAFIGFARYDGNLIDAGTHPVNYLVQAAS
ncbi:MAG TPA: phage major capsid protein [Candidatus Acidoferrales bacterium]